MPRAEQIPDKEPSDVGQNDDCERNEYPQMTRAGSPVLKRAHPHCQIGFILSPKRAPQKGRGE